MSYEKQTWETGDIITAEKLNKLDPGYSVETTTNDVIVFNNNVTTTNSYGISFATIALSELLTADTIKVTFNSTEYIVQKVSMSGSQYCYGEFTASGPLFTTYPFCITIDPNDSENNPPNIYTESAGTYSVKIEQSIEVTTAETSNEFNLAVESVIPPVMYIKQSYISNVGYQLDKTHNEISNHILSGGIAFIMTVDTITSRDLLIVLRVSSSNDSYQIWAMGLGTGTYDFSYTSVSANDYPVMS